MKIVDGKVVAETEEEKTALGATLEADATGLKSKNAELIGKLKELKKLEGIDADEYRTLKEQAAATEADRMKKSGEFDSLKTQLVTAHQKELETRTLRETSMKSALEQHLVDAEATRCIADAKGVPLLLLPHVKNRVRVEEEAGKYVTKVIDPATGAPRVKPDGSFLSITDLVAEMKADVATFGRAFEPSGSSGAGSQGSSGGSGGGAKTMKLNDFNNLNSKSRAAYMASGGILQE